MLNPRLKPFEEWLVHATIDDVQEKLTNKELTSYDLVMLYLDRIAKYNAGEKGINAVLEINPDALFIARALDDERKVKGPRSRMHGIPVLIKDNIDTKDKMHTSAGSVALANSYAKADSHVAKLLRESGAIILGKTNMTEWANFMAYKMVSGYSSRGGQVQNPYGPGKFDVGGSSSGTGAGIACSFATVGVGTETSGSILSPASQNSLVGIKPTVGLISRSGIIPISHTQDTAGPMTRTVKDAAILLSVLKGADPNDPATLTNNTVNVDYTKFLKTTLSGLRIGIHREYYFDYISEEKRSILNEAIKVLSELDAEVIDSVCIPSIKEKWDMNVLMYEFKNDLNAYLSYVEAPVHTLKDVILFNESQPEQMLKYGQGIFTDSEATTGKLTDPNYLSSLLNDQYHSREGGIDQLFSEHNLDAYVYPNNIGAGIPAKAGYPSITVPCGYTKEGEPVGITFSGLAFTETKLIQIAYAFEQATKSRVAPKLE